ncbi:MAG: GNAT family N-acetyltransferase [Candidatus Coatesbacteria bacterium]
MEFEVGEIPVVELARVIGPIIAIRTSAYERWNGQKSEEDQRKEAEAWLQKIPSRDGAAIFVAKTGGECIGYLWGNERTSGDFYISHVGVRQDGKRGGIGRALVKASEDLARKRGCRVLSTSTYNRFAGMLILLLSEGFEIVGTTKPEGKTDVRIELEKRLV